MDVKEKSVEHCGLIESEWDDTPPTCDSWAQQYASTPPSNWIPGSQHYGAVLHAHDWTPSSQQYGVTPPNHWATETQFIAVPSQDYGPALPPIGREFKPSTTIDPPKEVKKSEPSPVREKSQEPSKKTKDGPPPKYVIIYDYV